MRIISLQCCAFDEASNHCTICAGNDFNRGQLRPNPCRSTLSERIRQTPRLEAQTFGSANYGRDPTISAAAPVAFRRTGQEHFFEWKCRLGPWHSREFAPAPQRMQTPQGRQQPPMPFHRHRLQRICEAGAALAAHLVTPTFDGKYATQLPMVTPERKLQHIGQRMRDAVPQRNSFAPRHRITSTVPPSLSPAYAGSCDPLHVQ